MEQIEPGLFLGNFEDGRRFPGERLCVLENPPDYPHEGRTRHIPILTVPAGHNDAVPVWASRKQLDKAADYITEQLRAGKRLIVHCGQGVERSPLTVAWWLVKTGRCPTLKMAYVHLRASRPCVEDRCVWIEPG